ncbi:hypothetical protein [Paenibacillus durus]|nr:hypothetical protein [Paenibacillus durus]
MRSDWRGRVRHVTGVISAVGACVAYMLAKGFADGAGAENNEDGAEE